MTQVIVKSQNVDHVKPLIQAALDHEARILKIGLQKTTRKLHQFEQRFEMESQQFYQKFQAGNFEDEMEYMNLTLSCTDCGIPT